jgi:hypothetical protein
LLYVLFILQLKGNTLDATTVIDQAKDMIQYAKAQGVRVDENEMKSSVEDCSRKGKHPHTFLSRLLLSTKLNFGKSSLNLSQYLSPKPLPTH